MVAADQNAIAQWKKRVSADMKADKPQAVVTDMSSMKQSQQQLQQDSMAAPAMLLNRGMANQVQPVYTPPAMLPGAGMLNPTVPAYRPPGFFPGAGQPMQGNAASGQSTSIGNGISSDQWPKLVQHAMKPVGWNSVPALAAELSRYQTSPSKLIGKRVVAYVEINKQNQFVIKGSRGPRLILPQTDASQLYALRRQLVEQFDALYKWAADREKSEYQNALVRNERPGLMAQVPPTEVRAEQIKCAKVVVPARQAEVGEQRAIGKVLRSPHNTIQLAGLPGTAVPKIGPVYGVVTGIASVKTPVTIPKYRYAPNYTQPGVATDTLVISRPHVHYRVTLLFCARAPRYFSPAKKGPTGPIKSYVFKMKSGTKMDATTYTIGDFYYHLKWNGIDLPVAKDLVVKIIPVR